MDRYTITAGGRLVLHKVKYETVPEEEREYYGTPQWEEPFYQMIGSMRSIPVADVDVGAGETITFYTCRRADGKPAPGISCPASENTVSIPVIWYEYEAKFDDGGQLEYIKSTRRDEYEINVPKEYVKRKWIEPV